MRFPRMPIEEESPEQLGYDRVKFNLTESSVRDRSLAELGVRLDDLPLAYTDHLGHPELRSLVAARAGGGMTRDNVLLTAGAAGALFIVAITLLDRGDHILVLRPNYATNIETPRVLGCEVECIDLQFEQGFRVDPEELLARVRTDTRLISLTTPHNPTGVALDLATLSRIVEATEPLGIPILVDETYRDMSFTGRAPVAATLSPRVISVGSLSKSYGIPGIRLGWALSRDLPLMHRLLCAKEQIGICGSIIDEEIGFRAYLAGEDWIASNGRHLREAFGVVKTWIAGEPLLEWVEPTGGCVCFPRIRADARIDTDRFYRLLNGEHAAYVGPGHWFEQSDRHFRIGYGWPTRPELEGGLAAISDSLRRAQAN